MMICVLSVSRALASLFHGLGQLIRSNGGCLWIVAGRIDQNNAQLVGLAVRALQGLAAIEIKVNKRDESAMWFELLGNLLPTPILSILRTKLSGNAAQL
jgi:hypothetical protein